MIYVFYTLSVILSWLLFRIVYKNQGSAADKNLHGFTLISLLIPYWNVAFPLLIIIVHGLTTEDYKFNYKRFFWLNDKQVNK